MRKSGTVIKVDSISKEYRIDHAIAHGAQTFVEALSGAVAEPIRRLAGRKKRRSTSELFAALKDISFEVNQGEVVGIIGRNGAGKSTLLKVLCRITHPTRGRVEIRGRVASLLEVGTGFHPELSGRENIYLNGAILGMSQAEVRRKFDEIVDFAGVERFIDTPVKRYSSGMYVRLAFAVAAHLEPEVLIVDEVLAVGDAEFQARCLGKMKDVASHGRTVLFVSHNMDAIKRICETGILLDGGEIRKRGKVEDCIDAYVSASAKNRGSRGHIIEFPREVGKETCVRCIEILDKNDEPLKSPTTWGFVKFRIHYKSVEKIKSGSVALYISTSSGSLLTLCSTRPDSGKSMCIESGEGFVDCEFPALTLSAGAFLIGAGLAIPNQEWLYNQPHAGLFDVLGRDVFGSNMVPRTSRYPVPMPHSWRVDDRLPAIPTVPKSFSKTREDHAVRQKEGS